EALVHRALDQRLRDAEQLHLRAREREEVDGVELLEPLPLARSIDRGAQEVEVADARDLDRVLEREEEALARALLGLEREQVQAVVRDRAASDIVAGTAREHVRERRLAGTVRSHDRVHLARVDREVESLENLLA